MDEDWDEEIRREKVQQRSERKPIDSSYSNNNNPNDDWEERIPVKITPQQKQQQSHSFVYQVGCLRSNELDNNQKPGYRSSHRQEAYRRPERVSG